MQNPSSIFAAWLAGCGLLTALGAQAQTPPANDNCAGATVLVAGPGCSPIEATVAGATQSQPIGGCNGQAPGPANDVWFRFVATASTHTVACEGNFNGVLEGFTGSCGGLSSLACANNSPDYDEALTLTGLTVGATYYARYYPLAAQNVTDGTFRICVSNTAPPPVMAPANDDPSGAPDLPFALGAPLTPGTTQGATTTPPNGYTNGSSTPFCGIAARPSDVWFRFTTAASGQPGSTAAQVRVLGSAAAYVRVFRTPGPAGPFTELACATGGDFAAAPSLTVRGLSPATTYYVFVAPYRTNGQLGTFRIGATPLPANDLAVAAIHTLGTVSDFAAPVPVLVSVQNTGDAPIVNRDVALTVTGATPTNATVRLASLAPGAYATLTFPSLVLPAAPGSATNSFSVTLPADDVAANNTGSFNQTLQANALGILDRSQPLAANALAADDPGGAFAARFTLSRPARVQSITPTLFGTGGFFTASYRVELRAANGPSGGPGTLLYASPVQSVATAPSAPAVVVPDVNVPAGDVFAIIRQQDDLLFLGYQAEQPLRPNTFYYQSGPTAAWAPMPSILQVRFGLALGLAAPTVTAAQTAALAARLGLYPNPAHEQLFLKIPADLRPAARPAVLRNALGQTVRELSLATGAGGTAELNVRGLPAGVYVLQVPLSTGELLTKRVVLE